MFTVCAEDNRIPRIQPNVLESQVSIVYIDIEIHMLVPTSPNYPTSGSKYQETTMSWRWRERMGKKNL
jgi:hypothetical protein